MRGAATEVKVLPCGHEEWLDGHCGVMSCPAYLNWCALHLRDDETAQCSNPAAPPRGWGDS